VILLTIHFSSVILLQSKATKSKDLNNLKQELEIDDHKIPIAELYRRHNVNPETVSIPQSPSPKTQKNLIVRLGAIYFLFPNGKPVFPNLKKASTKTVY
jgi:hypothetical protein